MSVVFLERSHRINRQQQATIVFRDEYRRIESRIECQQFAFADVGEAGDSAVVNRLVDAQGFEIRLIVDFGDIHAESLRVCNDIAYGQEFGNVIPCFVRHAQIFVNRLQTLRTRPIDGATDITFAPVVGSQCKRPVAE